MLIYKLKIHNDKKNNQSAAVTPKIQPYVLSYVPLSLDLFAAGCFECKSIHTRDILKISVQIFRGIQVSFYFVTLRSLISNNISHVLQL